MTSSNSSIKLRGVSKDNILSCITIFSFNDEYTLKIDDWWAHSAFPSKQLFLSHTPAAVVLGSKVPSQVSWALFIIETWVCFPLVDNITMFLLDTGLSYPYWFRYDLIWHFTYASHTLSFPVTGLFVFTQLPVTSQQHKLRKPFSKVDFWGHLFFLFLFFLISTYVLKFQLTILQFQKHFKNNKKEMALKGFRTKPAKTNYRAWPPDPLVAAFNKIKYGGQTFGHLIQVIFSHIVPFVPPVTSTNVIVYPQDYIYYKSCIIVPNCAFTTIQP